MQTHNIYRMQSATVFKDQDIKNYNFAYCFVLMWNLVADTEGGTQAEGVWQQGVEENIWA